MVLLACRLAGWLAGWLAGFLINALKFVSRMQKAKAGRALVATLFDR
jgi:hypothetical protein